MSDVLPYDFSWAINSLLDRDFFAGHATLTETQLGDLAQLAERWQGHLDAGRFHLSVPLNLELNVPSAADFWTTQYAYQDLPAVDPSLLAELQKANLVIFKGDLKWVMPRTTHTATASSLATQSGSRPRRSTPRWVGG